MKPSSEPYSNHSRRMEFWRRGLLPARRSSAFRLDGKGLHSVSMCQSGHSRPQLDRLTIYGEPAVSVVVDGLGILLRWVDPGLENLENKEIESVHETGIDHLAFEVGETPGHQRRRHTLGWRLGEAEPLELVDIAARAIADSHDDGRQFQPRYGDHALFRCAP